MRILPSLPLPLRPFHKALLKCRPFLGAGSRSRPNPSALESPSSRLVFQGLTWKQHTGVPLEPKAISFHISQLHLWPKNLRKYLTILFQYETVFRPTSLSVRFQGSALFYFLFRRLSAYSYCFKCS